MLTLEQFRATRRFDGIAFVYDEGCIIEPVLNVFLVEGDPAQEYKSLDEAELALWSDPLMIPARTDLDVNACAAALLLGFDKREYFDQLPVGFRIQWEATDFTGCSTYGDMARAYAVKAVGFGRKWT